MRETLTSRERVYKALNHEEGDRYPIDLGMHFSTGISVFAYYNLREYLGLSTGAIQLADTVQMLARVDDDILERFHCDTVLLNPPFKKLKEWRPREDYRFLIPEQWNPVIEDGYYVVRQGDAVMRMPLEGFFFDGAWLQAAELDIFNPVQISAANMDPAELKREFGDKLTFWGGGCDTQNILGFKDEETVRQNARELSSIFKPGGGFVFNQVHNIMGNVPPQNIVAMFDEAYKNSFYCERKGEYSCSSLITGIS